MRLGVLERTRNGTASAPVGAAIPGTTVPAATRPAAGEPGWAHSRGKRIFDVCGAAALLLLLSPLLAAGALLRFRSIRRLFRVPELVKVLRGQLSFVGPVPGITRTPKATRYRPGLFCISSRSAESERAILSRIPETSVNDYRSRVLDPIRSALDERYMRHCSLWSDLKLLAVVGCRKIR